jgi:hypothetical protein
VTHRRFAAVRSFDLLRRWQEIIHWKHFEASAARIAPTDARERILSGGFAGESRQAGGHWFDPGWPHSIARLPT